MTNSSDFTNSEKEKRSMKLFLLSFQSVEIKNLSLQELEAMFKNISTLKRSIAYKQPDLNIPVYQINIPKELNDTFMEYVKLISVTFSLPDVIIVRNISPAIVVRQLLIQYIIY